MKTVLAAVTALVVVGGSQAAAPPGSPLTKRFAYDASAPLAVRDVGIVVDRRDGIEVHDVSFLSAGTRVEAYLVLPPGAGPFPAIVWSPGLNRGLAKRGAASIVVGHRLPTVTCATRDAAAYVREVVDLRRAVDLLAARTDVDATRLAFVGFSFGSNLGATLAAAEPRLRTIVLQSGMPYQSRWLRGWCTGRLKGKRLDAYVRGMAFADASCFVPFAWPAELLIQNGLRDTLRPRAEIQVLHRVASPPKITRWYQAGHPLNERTFADRDAFLAERLGAR